MKKSIFMRRMVALLFAAIVLSGVLSAAIYSFVMQHVYVQMQSKELLPMARAVAQIASGVPADIDQAGPLFSQENRGLLGAQLYVYDTNGNQVITSTDKHRNSSRENSNEGKKFSPIISPAVEKSLAGKEFTVSNAKLDGQGYLVVSVPVWNENNSRVIGAVVLTKKISELSGALLGLRLTLLLSTLLAFIIMLPVAYLAGRRMTLPILQMRDVSLAMAKGDFSVRADETQKGEIGELAVSLNDFSEKSQLLEKTRRDYVANVSHELRTPISAMRAMSETLLDGLVHGEPKRKQYYNNMVKESMYLSRLVDDLLELSRLQSGTVALKKTAFSLSELLCHTIDIYEKMAVDNGINLVLDANLTALPAVLSNEDRVEQVIVVLLDNALKHTPKCGTVTLSATPENNRIILSVTNTGEDIPEIDLPFVFDRFYKVDKSHSSGGTGLGLSIAKELLGLMGEDIHAENTGSGARFYFTVSVD